MEDFDPIANIPSPTAARPLLGLTVLVVEDSRYACEAMHLLCLRSGARIRRADCIASAKRHLQVYRPSVILVDVGLPDGSGLDLIAELTALSPRIDIILGLSGDEMLHDGVMAAGADGFFAKPVENIAQFQEAILAHLPADRRPSGPRVLKDETVNPDPLAYNDDLAHVASLINENYDERQVGYVAQFITGVAKSARDTVLARAGEDLAAAHALRQPTHQPIAALAGLVQKRLDRQLAI
ncbi:response regulator [Lentibacter sp. XHP0401]|uniref:response regulator n=1 Tax=Lentibacter sp. XHP0401 TaxID=2984334 RepID=UPI0021E718E2|nr:response regulator [Lentibacter sp. XHP0401]MCV2893555.1 response regulator [Lentibacter sp. XHP0401]